MPPRPLETLQRWVHAVITHPGGVLAGIDDNATRAALDLRLDAIESVILPSRALDSVQRLQIYHHAYYARLIECLREFFPALTHAIGKEAFDEFAFGYLQQYPSQSYTLNTLADRFVQFLRETKPTDDDTGEPSWADFMIELGQFEWTLEAVFDGLGNENDPPLSLDALRSTPPTDWGRVRLVPAPSLRLLAFSFPINDYYTAFRQNENSVNEPIEIPLPARSWVAIHRRDFVVRRSPLSLDQFRLLQGIVAGESLGAAIEQLAASEANDANQLAVQLPLWFQAWTSDRIFSAVEIHTQN